ncbi:MAG TPA: zinc-ribbon domain containing protein [Terracidiphilus sp.]
MDRELKCADCGSVFVFSAGEQEYFQEKGFKNDRKRCKACKAEREFGKRGIETRVTCSECGVETTVPFKPTQKRPVLCRGCFNKQAQQTGAASTQ